jgi:hypothetical protein
VLGKHPSALFSSLLTMITVDGLVSASAGKHEIAATTA